MQGQPIASVNLATSEPHRMVEYVGQLASEMAGLCADAGEDGLSDEMRLLAKKIEVRALELRIAARQAENHART